MNKGRVAAGRRTASGAHEGKKRMPFWGYIVLSLVVLGLGIGLTVYFSQSRGASQAANFSSPAGPLRLAVVGQPAPGFSLPDQFGRPYTLAPGDGKNHLLVFYMGNF